MALLAVVGALSMLSPVGAIDLPEPAWSAGDRWSWSSEEIQDTNSAPTVLCTTPLARSVNVDLDSHLTIHFSVPMDQARTEAAVSVDDNKSKNVPVALSWNSESNVLRLDPLAPLPSYRDINITLTNGAVSAVGLHLAASAKFKFATGNGSGAPRLISVTPSTGARDIHWNANSITLEFDASMDTVATERRITAEPGIAGPFGWTADRKTATWRIAAQLLPDTAYRVMVNDPDDYISPKLSPNATSAQGAKALPECETFTTGVPGAAARSMVIADPGATGFGIPAYRAKLESKGEFPGFELPPESFLDRHTLGWLGPSAGKPFTAPVLPLRFPLILGQEWSAGYVSNGTWLNYSYTVAREESIETLSKDHRHIRGTKIESALTATHCASDGCGVWKKEMTSITDVWFSGVVGYLSCIQLPGKKECDKGALRLTDSRYAGTIAFAPDSAMFIPALAAVGAVFAAAVLLPFLLPRLRRSPPKEPNPTRPQEVSR